MVEYEKPNKKRLGSTPQSTLVACSKLQKIETASFKLNFAQNESF